MLLDVERELVLPVCLKPVSPKPVSPSVARRRAERRQRRLHKRLEHLVGYVCNACDNDDIELPTVIAASESLGAVATLLRARANLDRFIARVQNAPCR